MAKQHNGTWKLLMWLAGALIALGGAYATIGWNTQRIDKIEPEVAKNSEHRVRDDEVTIWLKAAITKIEGQNKEILEAVRKP